MLFAIAHTVRARLNSRSRAQWEHEIDARLAQCRPAANFREAICMGPEQFILEMKRTSPSSNGSRVTVDVAETARLYAHCGASAISILTEPDYFGGNLSDLELAQQSASLPILRKDFIIDGMQILEAKAYGASAVLLIVALLPDSRLREFIETASSLRLDALVEVHTGSELALALDAGATIVGINNRDLRTMAIDLERGAELLAHVPDHCVRVAESGLKSRADIEAMRDAGAQAFLIGSAVMRARDRQAKIAELMGR